MFRSSAEILLLFLSTLFLSAFTIVKTPDPSEVKTSNMTDAERMEAFVQENWEAKFAPFFKDNAYPFLRVSKSLNEGSDQAGKQYGLRPDGEANPWNFVVFGEGTILAANTESRAATADVDVNGDGQGDFVLQLGPVIKGTTLRDAATFLSFADFRDQIEYAKLGRALNARAYAELTESLPVDGLEGATISFSGAFTVRSSTGELLVTPIVVRRVQ
jgi:predicted lipoprotein